MRKEGEDWSTTCLSSSVVGESNRARSSCFAESRIPLSRCTDGSVESQPRRTQACLCGSRRRTHKLGSPRHPQH